MANGEISDAEWKRLSRSVLALIHDIEATKQLERLNEVYRHTLKIMLRRFTDHFWSSRLEVSKAALEKSRADGITDIRKCEPRKLPKQLKSSYRLDHSLPIADLRAELLQITRQSEENVEKLLRTATIRKIWVTAEEDKKLKRYNRGNPTEAYRNAGIEIIMD